MKLAFTKMQGTGNDFVVFDAINQKVALRPAQIRRLADRHFGVGCDQVLLVERPTSPGADFAYRIFNADGGEVEQCGNGARCFAVFVRDRGLTHKTELAVQTLAGTIHPRLEPDGRVTVNMGVPRFEPAAIPFDAKQRANDYDLEVDGERIRVRVVSMGNPHAVQVVPDVERAPVAIQGPLIESHRRFPQRVNAGFLQIVDRTHVRLRVYERGAGETLACGTGACAAVVSGRQHGELDESVEVHLSGGTLGVRWVGEGEPVWMTGEATTVFDGTIELETL